MATNGRAWQRTLKNGKVEMYAASEAASLRIIATADVCEEVAEAFSNVTDTEFNFDSQPVFIEGQMSLVDDAA